LIRAAGACNQIGNGVDGIDAGLVIEEVDEQTRELRSRPAIMLLSVRGPSLGDHIP
jgi:hypothetical protein